MGLRDINNVKVLYTLNVIIGQLKSVKKKKWKIKFEQVYYISYDSIWIYFPCNKYDPHEQLFPWIVHNID